MVLVLSLIQNIWYIKPYFLAYKIISLILKFFFFEIVCIENYNNDQSDTWASFKFQFLVIFSYK